jgi:hypothetical protein
VKLGDFRRALRVGRVRLPGRAEFILAHDDGDCMCSCGHVRDGHAIEGSRISVRSLRLENGECVFCSCVHFTPVDTFRCEYCGNHVRDTVLGDHCNDCALVSKPHDCPDCNGTGYSKRPSLGEEPCERCEGNGKLNSDGKPAVKWWIKNCDNCGREMSVKDGVDDDTLCIGCASEARAARPGRDRMEEP